MLNQRDSNVEGHVHIDRNYPACSSSVANLVLIDSKRSIASNLFSMLCRENRRDSMVSLLDELARYNNNRISI